MLIPDEGDELEVASGDDAFKAGVDDDEEEEKGCKSGSRTGREAEGRGTGIDGCFSSCFWKAKEIQSAIMSIA